MFYKVSSDEDIDTVIALAREIWTEHYTPIIGPEQVEYMLNNFHSRAAIRREIHEDGYQYYLIKKQNIAIGYTGFRVNRGELFLSKLYLRSDQRGQGMGQSAMTFINEQAKKQQVRRMHLTVNRFNTGSIAAYEKFGFNKAGEICTDIGQGYVMDDYKMEFIL